MSSLRRSQILVLLPLLGGIVLVFMIPRVHSLVEIEHRFFHIPNFQEKAIEREPLNEFRISTYRIIPSKPVAQKNLVRPSGHSITDWMLSLNTLRTNGAEHITISPLLSWAAADELELRALEYEVNNFPTATLGYDLQLKSIPQPFPDYLIKSQLEKITGDTSLISEVNSVSTPPSITCDLHGFRLMENDQPQMSAKFIQIPLLARWGDRVIPSLELASLISRRGQNCSEVEVHLGSHIRLPNGGPIISIDASGRTKVPRNKETLETTSFEILNSKNTPTRIVVSDLNDPPHLRQLSKSLDHLSGSHGEAGNYQRLPFWIEVPILILLSLLLAIMARLAILLLPLPILIPHFSSYWLLWIPGLVIAVGFFVLRIIIKRPKT